MTKKQSKRKKVTTLEGLAELVVTEFSQFRDEVNERFEDVNKRFEEVNKRFDTLTDIIESIDRRLTALESKVSGIERRLDSEAMERMDVKAVYERLQKLEKAVFSK